MKKTYLLIIAILILSSSVFSSCGLFKKEEIIVKDGIETFAKETSSVSLNQWILPSVEFIDEFVYIDMDYHYKSVYTGLFYTDGAERSIIYAKYDEAIYSQAKQYCFDEMELSNENIIEYNGYRFIQNIKALKDFPSWFNMFAYNDDLNSLVFLGYYTTDDAEEITYNWGEFLIEQFGEWYSFEN